MRYDPIMCMMVPDSVKTKDSNKNEGYKIHKAEIRGDKLYLTYTDLLYGGKETESFTKSEAKGFLTDPWNTWEGNTKSVMMKFVKDSKTVETKDANKYVEKAVQLIKEGKGPIAILSTLKGMGLTPADANSYYAEAKSLTGYRSYDEKALDKAIRSCDEQIRLVKTISKKNGYAIHIVEGGYGERIVLTFPNESYANPHMWLGSNNPSNIQKAKELLDEFSK